MAMFFPAKTSGRGNKGIALVLVLFGTTLLALAAISIAQSSGMAVKQMRNAVESAQARALLETAEAASVVALIDPNPDIRWIADGASHSVALEGGKAIVRAQAAAGMIDLNQSAAQALRQLFRNATEDPSFGDRLAEEVIERSRGKTARPFLAVEEIAALPGMTAPLYRRLAASLTVHNETGNINWRLANRDVLNAIPDLTAEQRATLWAMRGQKNWTPTPDIAAALTKSGMPAQSAVPEIVLLAISVKMESGAEASCEATIRLPAAQILEWRDR